MKIYKNGIAKYEVEKEIEHLLKVWGTPSPSTAEIIDFFRLSFKYPHVELIRVRQ